jgi:hypothetical protein
MPSAVTSYKFWFFPQIMYVRCTNFITTSPLYFPKHDEQVEPSNGRRLCSLWGSKQIFIQTTFWSLPPPCSFFLSIIPTVRLRLQWTPRLTTFQQHKFPLYQPNCRCGHITDSFLFRYYTVSESGRLSTSCFRQLLASSCLSVNLPSWNHSTTIARFFMKFYI